MGLIVNGINITDIMRATTSVNYGVRLDKLGDTESKVPTAFENFE